MIKEFFRNLAKIIHLRSIIGYNGLVFALKKTPVIGKIIPDRLYSTTFLKVIYWIFHVIKEVFKLFVGKIIGLGTIYVASWILSNTYVDYGQAPGITQSDLYASFALLFFFLYALCGILINRPYFRCTTEKEYLVFMLRMNARKLNNTLFIYDLGKLVIGYFIAGLIAIVTGAPIWLWILIPVLAVLIKLSGTGFLAFCYRIKNKHHKLMRSSQASFTFRLLLVSVFIPIIVGAFVFIFVANGSFISLPVMLALAGVVSVLGILGYIELNRFDSGLHRRALHDNINIKEIEFNKKPDTTKNFKKIKANGSVNENKKGFEYLNALFMKRHGRMLVVKPIVFAVLAIILASLIIGGFITHYYKAFGAYDCTNMVIKNLWNMILWGRFEDSMEPFDPESTMSFFRWLIQTHMLLMMIPAAAADNSFKSTQAMFINCDNSLMTFSFFKQRDKIIKLFDIRLKQLIKISVIPSVAFALLANLFLFYTGGQDYPMHYLVNILISVLIGVIYNVTWLSTYYLFQPFTTSLNVKGGIYKVIQVVLGFVFSIVCLIPVNSIVLFGILLVFTVFFIFVMRKLVYKNAPRTWRIKS